MAHRSKNLNVVALLMLLTALGIIVFWMLFFADLDAQRRSVFAARSNAWFAWELSFPLPDAWVAATAILGGTGLWRKRPSGLLFGLASGSAMVFLGLIDALFFLENDLYLPMNSEVLVELFLHLWLTGLGTFSMAIIWKHRKQLLDS
jgi:hypothetical protein